MTSVFTDKQDRYHATASAGAYCLNRDIHPSRIFNSHRLLLKTPLPRIDDPWTQLENTENNDSYDPQP